MSIDRALRPMVTLLREPFTLSSMNLAIGSPASERVSGNGGVPGGSLALLLVILLAAAGCGVLRAPQRVVTAVVPGKPAPGPDPLEIQVQVQRFADSFAMQTAQALDDYAANAGTESARIEALQLKLLSWSAVTGIASGPNPNANLLDLVAVVTLSRMAVEDRWHKTDNQAAFESWLAASRTLETNVWQLATSVLKPAHVNELRETIAQWWVQNPNARTAFLVRPQEFAVLVTKSPKRGADLTSVFSLVNLDPTSGLDPAVREITQTRLLAERALFTLQHMPFLLRWQTEFLTYQLADQPGVRLVLTNATRLAESADRISRATESASQTAAQLPDRIATERREILAALDLHEGRLKELAGQVNDALISGEKMSTSLNTTIGTFDRLMKRFGVGERAPRPAADTNSPPFNILDYGQVAQQVGTMSKDINTLISSVNQSVPQLDRLSQRAAEDARKVVDRGFRLGLVLIVVLLGGAVAVGLTYRFLSEKLNRRGNPPRVSTP